MASLHGACECGREEGCAMTRASSAESRDLKSSFCSLNVPAGPLFGPDSRSMSSGDARTDLAVFSQQVFL